MVVMAGFVGGACDAWDAGSTRLERHGRRYGAVCGSRARGRGTPSRTNKGAPVASGRVLEPSRQKSRFDAVAVGAPVVKRFEGENQTRTWYLWYSGLGEPHEKEPFRIGLAVSNNGVLWERHEGSYGKESVLDVNVDEWWAFDTEHVVVGDIQLLSSLKVRAEGSVFFMFYHGTDHVELDVDASIMGLLSASRVTRATSSLKSSRIGVALSLDGFHWSRIEGDFANGAVLDVRPSQRPDGLGVLYRYPSVIQTDEELLMVFNKVVVDDRYTARSEIHLATSQDGLKWSELGSILPLDLQESGILGYGRPSVLRLADNEYVMFVELIGGAGCAYERSIGMARSANGRHWILATDEDGSYACVSRSSEDNAADCSSIAWDGGGVGSPFAILADDIDTVNLYYEGYAAPPGSSPQQNGNDESLTPAAHIGLATCALSKLHEPEGLPKFQRVQLPTIP
ncbi:hypothetical protein FVE85_8125 [Porphyridium purpureum]|uniref:Uncharacterized protein n=1 Tax=Porphyridium purpureum TaxID=35688 RepID=A0A5J4YMZ1_PORPP|nr:hypothetical protein FVE85_8125 [Porphyridium purpureum]|eukprot:POR1239..scf295_9